MKNVKGRDLVVGILLLICCVSCFDFKPELETNEDVFKAELNNRLFSEKDSSLFREWHRLYKRKYSLTSKEGLKRYTTFQVNLNRIRTNLLDTEASFKTGLNDFSDQTLEELAGKYLDLNMKDFTKKTTPLLRGNIDFSASFNPIDWREKNIFLPIRNQGDCGGCWAFASLGTLEAMRKLKGLPNNNYLSVQQLIDCDSKEKGCKGGWPSIAYSYISKTGSVLDSDYPYEAENKTCKSDIVEHNVVAKIDRSIVSCEEEECLTNNFQNNMLQNGPMAVVIDAYNTLFFNYKSGIYNQSCAEPNHAIVLVGFGVDSKTKEEYLIIRNSWGVDWGMGGYGYVKYDPKNYYSCNLNRYGFQPKVLQ